MSLFNKQTLITITLDCGTTVTGASTARILYKKPNGTTGYWTATPSTQYLIYSVLNGDIDQSGVWEFQAYAVLSGKIAYGEIVYRNFKEPIL